MGLMDKIGKGLKDATGIGLSADEQYKRAYEKGVFMKDLDSAASNFFKAAEKFEKDGNPERAARAKANAAVYSLVNSKSTEDIADTIVTLKEVSEIEQLWTDKETADPKMWIGELSAYQAELTADGSDDFGEKKAQYKSGADSLLTLGTAPLTFAEILGVEGPREKALTRSYYYSGLSDYYDAHMLVYSVPSDAESAMQKALMRFKQTNESDMCTNVEALLNKIKAKRHCWMCGREMQAEEFHYNYYPADVSDYHKSRIKAGNEDSGMLDRDDSVTICSVCGTAIEKQADRYATARANEVREWASEKFDQVSSKLNNLENRLSRVEDRLRNINK